MTTYHVVQPGTDPFVLRLLLLPLSLACACALPRSAIEPRYGPVNVAGDFGIESSAASADNSVEDAGIDDDDGTPSLRGDFDWGGTHLSVTLQRSVHDGSGTLDADMSQGGTTIPAGTDVVTDFDLDLHTAYLTFDVLSGESGELGLGFGFALVAVDYRTRDAAGTATITADDEQPLPLGAARAFKDFGRIQLEGQAGLLFIAALEEERHFLDLDMQGRLRLFGSAEHATGWLTLGLRHSSLDFEHDVSGAEVAEEMGITGPYVGLRVQL